MAAFVPEYAPVRPRVRGMGIDASRLLEEIVEEYADEHPTGIVWLCGERGAGKTTALAHLAATFSEDNRFVYVDDSDEIEGDAACAAFVEHSERALVIATRKISANTGHKLLRLEGWRRDELIEYLLARHPQQCGDVLSRLGAEANYTWTADVARVLLDEFAGNQELHDPASALDAYMRRELPHAWQRKAARKLCLAIQQGGGDARGSMLPNTHSLPYHVKRLISHKLVQLPLAAEQVALELSKHGSSKVLRSQLSLGLVEAIAERAYSNDDVQRALEKVLTSRQCEKNHAMAASILHVIDRRWRPSRTEGRDFSGAYFSSANWPKISFRRTQLQLAEFLQSDLTRADFGEAIVVETDFVQANLYEASFRESLAVGADFDRSVLIKADFNGSKLESASFVGANLREARLAKANLCNADLTAANLRRADLGSAMLVGAGLKHTDLTECDLRHVDARRVDLRTAKMDGAHLGWARLINANLEDIVWHNARLGEANLCRAHLTGSRLPSANLRLANLTEAGLGEIDWEGADLRGANLTGATFHMGSSRSGLVDSPIASEGTRTGFYTDDLEDLYYKSPEEVRKANLKGADLRGANLSRVDFYLVDLRGARLDPEQRLQAQRTGAILSG